MIQAFGEESYETLGAVMYGTTWLSEASAESLQQGFSCGHNDFLSWKKKILI